MYTAAPTPTCRPASRPPRPTPHAPPQRRNDKNMSNATRRCQTVCIPPTSYVRTTASLLHTRTHSPLSPPAPPPRAGRTHFAIWRVRSSPPCSRKSWFTLAPLRRLSQRGFPLRVPVSVASATVERGRGLSSPAPPPPPPPPPPVPASPVPASPAAPVLVVWGMRLCGGALRCVAVRCGAVSVTRTERNGMKTNSLVYLRAKRRVVV